jgi:DNA mismatch repair protein MutS
MSDVTEDLTPLVQEYTEIYNSYKIKYGDKYVVFYQQGKFYEIYLSLEDIKPIADVLLLRTRKIRGTNNMYTAGFPIEKIKDYIDKLTTNNYIAIIYNQDGKNTKNKRIIRVFHSIYSECTNTELDENEISVDCMNIMCIYIEYDGYKIIDCNITTIDTFTGNSNIILTKNDTYENILKIINIYNPKQILINVEKCIIGSDVIAEHLNLKGKLYHIRKDEVDLNYKKPAMQDKFFEEIFGKHLISPVEYLKLEKYPSMIVCYILLLAFIKEFNSILVSNLTIPKIVNHTDTINLNENTINQLNLIDKHKYCLFNLLNNTCTSGGRRYLKAKLCAPIKNIATIKRLYDYTELMIPVVESFKEHLYNIGDIERLHRKIYMKKLNPNDMFYLDSYYKSCAIVINLALSHKICDNIVTAELYQKFCSLYNYYNSYFEITLFKNIKLDGSYDNNIFKPGTYGVLDKHYSYILTLRTQIENYAKLYANSVGEQTALKIDYLPSEGYFIICPNKHKVSLFNKYPDIESKDRTNNSKITNPIIRSCNSEIQNIQNLCDKLSNDKYLEFLNFLSENYRTLHMEISEAINMIDFICCNARNSISLKLCKPTIVENYSKSFVKATDLRNLVIENVDKSVEFVSNDVNLGTDIDAIVLYGFNGSGKSSFLRSIGAAIVLAQSGLYVPAKTFEYKPYSNILIKMNNTDNVYGKKSTFINEILEIKNFLDFKGPDTLVLGDELAKGTENKSEISLVAACLHSLVNSKTSVVFVTHIYELTDIPIIAEMKNIGVYHVSTNILPDQKNGIQYGRKIKLGKCSKKYGIEIAQSLGLEQDFISTAFNTRNALDHTENSYKVSRYNSDLIFNKCEICTSPENLHTHHIIPQAVFKNGTSSVTFEKNIKHNLVPLCEKCHNDVHNGILEIKGYITTTTGVKLDYNKNTSK